MALAVLLGLAARIWAPCEGGVVGVAEGLAPKERCLPPPGRQTCSAKVKIEMALAVRLDLAARIWAPCEGGVVGVVEGLAPKERCLPPPGRQTACFSPPHPLFSPHHTPGS